MANHALIIGAGDIAGLSPLPTAQSDAQTIAETVEDLLYGYIGVFPANAIVTFYDAAAQPAAILNSLSSWSGESSNIMLCSCAGYASVAHMFCLPFRRLPSLCRCACAQTARDGGHPPLLVQRTPATDACSASRPAAALFARGAGAAAHTRSSRNVRSARRCTHQACRYQPSARRSSASGRTVRRVTSPAPPRS